MVYLEYCFNTLYSSVIYAYYCFNLKGENDCSLFLLKNVVPFGQIESWTLKANFDKKIAMTEVMLIKSENLKQ